MNICVVFIDVKDRRNMEKKVFKKLLSDLLRQYGFQYIQKAYYLSNDEVVIVIETQKSHFEDSYYLNYGLLIKELNPELKYPKERKCDVRGRFVFSKNNKLVGGFNLEDGTEDELKQSVLDTMENLLIPVFKNGLSEYYKLSPQSILTASLKAKKYLGMD